MPERFRDFDVAEARVAGQRVVISRTGLTNELGWERYLEPEPDARALGDRLLEAGLLNAGSDFDRTVMPFAAGRGALVDPMAVATLRPGADLEVDCTDRKRHRARRSELPMYGQAREIPRGKRLEIPGATTSSK